MYDMHEIAILLCLALIEIWKIHPFHQLLLVWFLLLVTYNIFRSMKTNFPSNKVELKVMGSRDRAVIHVMSGSGLDIGRSVTMKVANIT